MTFLLLIIKTIMKFIIASIDLLFDWRVYASTLNLKNNLSLLASMYYLFLFVSFIHAIHSGYVNIN